MVCICVVFCLLCVEVPFVSFPCRGLSNRSFVVVDCLSEGDQNGITKWMEPIVWEHAQVRETIERGQTDALKNKKSRSEADTHQRTR